MNLYVLTKSKDNEIDNLVKETIAEIRHAVIFTLTMRKENFMHYEEAIIDGVLSYRGSVDEPWTVFTAHQLTERIEELRIQIQELWQYIPVTSAEDFHKNAPRVVDYRGQ